MPRMNDTSIQGESNELAPHDVLAAEEFALPATPPHPGGPVTGPSRRAWWRGVLAAAVLLALGAKLRRRRAR